MPWDLQDRINTFSYSSTVISFQERAMSKTLEPRQESTIR